MLLYVVCWTNAAYRHRTYTHCYHCIEFQYSGGKRSDRNLEKKMSLAYTAKLHCDRANCRTRFESVKLRCGACNLYMYIGRKADRAFRQIWSRAPLRGIAVTRRSFPTTRRHTHETLSLTVLITLFFHLNSTTFYTSYFRRLALAVVSSQHGNFGQPSHKLCWLLASTPTQLDPALDFLKM